MRSKLAGVLSIRTYRSVGNLAALCAAAFLPFAALALDDPFAESEGLDEVMAFLDNSPRLLFYASMDGAVAGVTERYRIGSTGTGLSELRFEQGVSGLAVRCERHRISYPVADVMDTRRGSLSFWYKWDEDPAYRHSARFAGPAAMANGNLDFGMTVFSARPGTWQHWTITWDYSRRMAELYLDGERVESIPMREPFDEGTLRIGYGAAGLLDEVAVFANVLTPESIQAHRRRIASGEKGWAGFSGPPPAFHRYPLRIEAQAAERPALPPAVDRTLPPASESGARFRYALGGLWRVQPFATRMSLPPEPGSSVEEPFVQHPPYHPEPQKWGYAAVPGGWRGGVRESTLLLDESASRPALRWNDIVVSTYPAAWLERDFKTPPDDGCNAVFLVCEATYDTCDFYLNDVYLGSSRGGAMHAGASFDVTDIVHAPGESNRLTVLAGRPYGRFRHTTWDNEIVWEYSGIRGPVYLETRPSRALNVSDIFAMPSYREKRLGIEFMVSNTGGLTDGVVMDCAIEDLEDGSRIHLGSSALKLTGEARERRMVSFDWDEPVLWFPDDPRLLKMHLEFRHEDRLMDSPAPVRFGFREVWADGGDMVMNGVPFRLRGSGNGWESRGAGVRSLIEHYRLRGMNSAIGWFLGYTPQPTLGDALRVADEMGFLSAFTIYKPIAGTEEYRENYLRNLLKNFRNHPSVYGYNIGGTPYCIGYMNDPISLGRPLSDADTEDSLYRANVDAYERIRAIDPTRPAGFYTRGVVGDYRSAMQYIGFGTPMQTREELFSYWASTRPAPFIGTEMDMSLFGYAYLWQRGGFRNEDYILGKGVVPLATEHAARYWGEAAYDGDTAGWVRQIPAQLADPESVYRNPDDPGSPYGIRAHPNFQKLSALTVRRTCRSWRTWGVSFQAHSAIYHHAHLREGDPANDPWWPACREFARNNMEFLAYVAGEPGNFVNKDHAYFAGERIRKQIVMINDFFHPKTVEAEWVVMEKRSGRVIERFESKSMLRGGEIRKIPFGFDAPRVNEKTAYVIRLGATIEGIGQNDDFILEVFPKTDPANPEPQARFALLDLTGDASGLLTLADAAYRTIDPAAGDWIGEIDPSEEILVIGRESLPDIPAQRRLLAKAASEGLRILCLEQTARNVFGLRNDDPNTRHAFISAAVHPIVHGLDDADFRNWRGQSNILESYPDYRKGFQYGRLDHYSAKGFYGENEFTQWSSQGTVAAFHLEKPRLGDTIPILSSGFDMLYTPLIELFLGRGTLILCTLDVSNRYGVDPVATRIVNGILETISRRPPPPPPVAMALWGHEGWDGVMSSLGRRFARIADLSDLDGFGVLWLGINEGTERSGPKSAAQQQAAMRDEARRQRDSLDLLAVRGPETEKVGEALLKELIEEESGDPWLTDELGKRLEQVRNAASSLADFVRNGGTLIIPFVPDDDCLDWLPFPMNLDHREGFRARPAGVPELQGLTASDFFLREVLNWPVFTELPPEGRGDDGGFTAVVPYGQGRFIFSQLYPDMFAASWQRSKMQGVLSTLLRQAGAPAMAWDAETMPEQLDSLWYEAPALDFNPDLHRSW